MKKHHTGYEFDGKTVPSRMILDAFRFKLGSGFKNTIKEHFLKWGKMPNTQGSRAIMLEGIGKDMVKVEKSVFGIPSQFVPMNADMTARLKGINSPMVDSGELMEAVSYKTSITNTVVT